MGLAENAKLGHLEPRPTSYLNDSYYQLSTLYRLLAPCAVLKILQRRLTLVDLSLDKTIWRQYTLARQLLFALGDEFQLARMEPHLDYKPLDKDADRKAKTDPVVYYRQGLPLGVLEVVVESLLVTADGREPRLKTYAECEAEYERKGSTIQQEFDGILFLIEDFHPRSRPVVWRMLVTQACLCRALYQQSEFELPD